MRGGDVCRLLDFILTIMYLPVKKLQASVVSSSFRQTEILHLPVLAPVPSGSVRAH
jgi:hypothetical protein